MKVYVAEIITADEYDTKIRLNKPFSEPKYKKWSIATFDVNSISEFINSLESFIRDDIVLHPFNDDKYIKQAYNILYGENDV